MAQRNPEIIGTDWVDWWKPSEAQVEWRAAFVEYKRKQLVQQAKSGGYGYLTRRLIPPSYEFEVDILDPVPTAEEVEAMRREAAGPIEPLPTPDGDWSMFDDDDDPEGTALLKWLDARFPQGWDWLYWLDRSSADGESFFVRLRTENAAAADHFCTEEDDPS